MEEREAGWLRGGTTEARRPSRRLLARLRAARAGPSPVRARRGVGRDGGCRPGLRRARLVAGSTRGGPPWRPLAAGLVASAVVGSLSGYALSYASGGPAIVVVTVTSPTSPDQVTSTHTRPIPRHPGRYHPADAAPRSAPCPPDRPRRRGLGLHRRRVGNGGTAARLRGAPTPPSSPTPRRLRDPHPNDLTSTATSPTPRLPPSRRRLLRYRLRRRRDRSAAAPTPARLGAPGYTVTPEPRPKEGAVLSVASGSGSSSESCSSWAALPRSWSGPSRPSTPPRSRPTRPAISRGAGSADASADVKLGPIAAPDALGIRYGTVLITNHSSEAFDYYIELRVLDASGTNIGDQRDRRPGAPGGKAKAQIADRGEGRGQGRDHRDPAHREPVAPRGTVRHRAVPLRRSEVISGAARSATLCSRAAGS